MTWVLILTYIKKFFTFLWEYKAVLLISLLMFFITILRDDIRQAEKETIITQTAFNEYKVKQQEALTLAQVRAKEKEIEMLKDQAIIEDRYNNEIKNMSNDIASLTASNSRMQQSLTTINQRLVNAPEQQVRIYASTSTELLEDCTTKYVEMAGNAEQHKLAERKAVDSYNTLIDNFNKE